MFPPYGPVVQLVRTLACHARGQGFESPSGRHLLFLKEKVSKRTFNVACAVLRVVYLSPESETIEEDNADLAHLVERRLAKAKVAGSSPVIRSRTMRVRFIRIRIC